MADKPQMTQDPSGLALQLYDPGEDTKTPDKQGTNLC